MTNFDLILTHPGGAHKYEFLAGGVLLAEQPVSLVRREPTPEDLARVATCVVDVGHSHDPALNNFDHHQFPRDHVPTCSLSLVLQHLGLYADAREFCEWLEPAEWFDCRGPFVTAEWLGVERGLLTRLTSPIDVSLLRRFAAASRLDPGQPLWAIMRMIGEDLLDYVRTLRARLEFLARHAELWPLALPDGPAQVLFLPRTDPIPDDPALGMDRFLERRGLNASVIGLVYPDRRGPGFALNRYRDSARLDFSRVATHPAVRFAHARGFVAKTDTTDLAVLRTLLHGAAGLD
eukprot:gene37996-biopygen25213